MQPNFIYDVINNIIIDVTIIIIQKKKQRKKTLFFISKKKNLKMEILALPHMHSSWNLNLLMIKR